MTRHDHDNLSAADNSLEEILAQASPRPTPTADELEQARQAVHSEWRRAASRHRFSRRFISLAVAATVMLALALAVNYLDVGNTSSIQVAEIETSIGSIYVLGEQSQRVETDDLSSVVAGQTIVTRDESVIGLHWNQGGSLRIGANSRVRFLTTESIELLAGSVYFDSSPFVLADHDRIEPVLLIETAQGSVTHIGTQYMTQLDGETLTVSVRAGKAKITGIIYDDTAQAGERLTIRGDSRPSRVSMPPYGYEWRWIETASPPSSLTDPTVHEFLLWIRHETGLKIEFANGELEKSIRDVTLYEELVGEPRVLLRQRMATLGLDYKIVNGTIRIGSRGD